MTMRERMEQHRANPAVRQLPQGDGSARLRARELRRRRRVACPRRRGPRSTPAACSSTGRAIDGPAALRAGGAGAAREFRRQPDREDADLRRSAAASITATCRPCARSCATPAARDYRFSSLVLGIVRSDAVPEAHQSRRTHRRTEETAHVHHQDVVAPAHVAERHGRHASRCRSSTRWCRRSPPALKAAAGPRRAAFIYWSNGTMIEHWTPAATGKGSPTRRS